MMDSHIFFPRSGHDPTQGRTDPERRTEDQTATILHRHLPPPPPPLADAATAANHVVGGRTEDGRQLGSVQQRVEEILLLQSLTTGSQTDGAASSGCF
jgi:hypothetical protein